LRPEIVKKGGKGGGMAAAVQGEEGAEGNAAAAQADG
jgi:hypothetical protein